MDPWTIAAWMVPAHLLGSFVALAIVSINRGERDEAPAWDASAAPLDPGTVPRRPRA